MFWSWIRNNTQLENCNEFTIPLYVEKNIEIYPSYNYRVYLYISQ